MTLATFKLAVNVVGEL